jgi:hypothetical protein
VIVLATVYFVYALAEGVTCKSRVLDVFYATSCARSRQMLTFVNRTEDLGVWDRADQGEICFRNRANDLSNDLPNRSDERVSSGSAA